MSVTRLRDLETKEVSLVTRAANKRTFLILKNQEGDPMDGEDILKAVLDSDIENEAQVDEVMKSAELSDQAQAAIKGALRLVAAYKDEVPAEVVNKLFGVEVEKKAPPVPPPPAEDEEEEEEEVPVDEEEETPVPPEPKGKKQPPVTKKKGCDDKMEKCAPVKKSDGTWDLDTFPEDMRPVMADIFKSQEEAVQKANNLEIALKAEKDSQRTKEFVAKAAELDQLVLKSDELGGVLKTIADSVPAETYGKLDQVLKAANEGLRQCGLLKQRGSDFTNRAGDGAWKRIEAEATKIVEKGEGLTHEQAIDRVLKEQPNLYQDYLDEQKRK